VRRRAVLQRGAEPVPAQEGPARLSLQNVLQDHAGVLTAGQETEQHSKPTLQYVALYIIK